MIRPKAAKKTPDMKRMGSRAMVQTEGQTPKSGRVASMMMAANSPLLAPQKISPRAISVMPSGVMRIAS